MMPTKLSLDEDFILTISDKDEISESELESDNSDAAKSRPSKKRKRTSDRQNDSVKKRKSAQSERRGAAVEATDGSSSEDQQGAKDNSIDSDFEFDIGVNAVADTVEDFDGWGDAEKMNGDTKSNKITKGVDIDEILARRVAKRKIQGKTVSGNSVEELSGDGDHPSTDSEDSSADEEIDFEDENLAEDTFGANAPDLDGADEEEEQQDDDESVASSVASPMPHPEDMASDDNSDDASDTSQSDAEEVAKRKAFFASEEVEAEPKSKADSFQQFSLSRPIFRGLAALNFVTPTPIQTRTIPIALQGVDVVGSAQTGSGKTAAFLLPILERLLYRPRKVPTTRVAILMPTRELAVQCYSVAIALARFTDITFAQVVGGFSLREQEAILKKRPDVVIATPGRFIDHMRNSASFAVESLEILVLDEADRMLDQGFADELDEILRTIPKSRQTMLFSATMTESVDKLVRAGMNRPVRVNVDAKKSTVSGLIQEFVRLRPGREEMRLASLCLLCTQVPDYKERTIIFFRQKKEAHRVRVVFGLLGIKAGELHGSMTQEQRLSAVNGFRDGRTTHLLATDVASRGLDIKNVMSVINYEAPQTHEIYLHRVGRTARAGRSGKSCTIAAEPDRKIVKSAVKSARAQGAKVVSRILDAAQLNSLNSEIEDLAEEIEEVLKEEKQEKQIAQMEKDVQRGTNLVQHHNEIMARPKRTWFESEKEKAAAKARAKEELNLKLFKGEKKKLSNKNKKKMDLHRERTEGNRQWKKGKTDADEAAVKRKDKKSKQKKRINDKRKERIGK